MRKSIQYVRGSLSLLSLLAVLLWTLPALAQNTIDVRGTVTEKKTKEPLLGVSVRVEGTGQGMSTNIDGKYTLKGVSPKATLVFSFSGMKTMKVPVSGKTTINVELAEDDKLLEELVVVAYGKTKKVNLTGAVSSLDSKALEARPVATVSQALQGLVPGLNFSVNNGGGALNSRMSMNIRGAGTIGSGSDSSPLVLIDGVEGDMNTLAPSDIENISVLKDASSSSIYGSRAAFGVILITTKSGREGKTRITYNGNMRFSTATQVPNMMDSEMFAKYFNRAAQNKGDVAPFSEEYIAKIIKFKKGEFAADDPDRIGTTWDKNGRSWGLYSNAWANTNWFKEMYQDNVPAHEHNVSISGGGSKISYLLSGALLNQRGLIRYGKDTFQRYNFTAKLNAQLYSWLRVAYTHRWVREEYERPSYMTGLFFHNIARRWPMNPVRDINGHLIPGNETIQMSQGGVDRNQKDFVNQQLNFTIQPFEGLDIHLENGYNNTYNNNHWDVLPTFGYTPENVPYYTNRDDNTPGNVTNVSESAHKNMYFTGRYFAQYSKLFNDLHDVRVSLGNDIEINKYRDLGGNKRDLITPSIPTLNTALNEKPTFYGGYRHWATMGFFGRVNYVYSDRYLAEVSLRYNGSSRFIGDKTWGLFPAMSLGWNMANEGFWAPLRKTISQFKIRGSWGALGNTNTRELYPWYQAIPVGASGVTSGSSWMVNGNRLFTSNAPGIVSRALTWERVESWNAGVDFTAFRSRLQGTFDYFARTTKDMVGPPAPVSSILGTAQPRINNANLRSYGWELELRWRDQVGDFKYGAKLVLSDNQVEVTKYYNPNNSLSDWYVGRKAGEIWGYETVGIAKTDEEITEHLKKNKPAWGNKWAAGDVMYRNQNPGEGEGKDYDVNNGKNTLEDHGDLRIIGNTSPRYSFSVTLDAAYKGFDFSMLLQGVGKRDFWDASPYSVGANVGFWQSAAFTDHWDFFRPEGDPLGANVNAHFPRPLFNEGDKNFRVQTRFLQDASYMRIKNIQLGYTIPSALTQKIGLSSLRIYASVDNLTTFTKMNKIFDPEATGGDWGPGKIYPLQRTVSFGLNVNL